MSKAEETSTCSKKGAGLLILKGEQTQQAGDVGRSRALRVALREASSLCSIRRAEGAAGGAPAQGWNKQSYRLCKLFSQGHCWCSQWGKNPRAGHRRLFSLQAPISMQLFLTLHCFHCRVMQPLIPSAVSPLSLHTHQKHFMTNCPPEFFPYLISAVANRVKFHS